MHTKLITIFIACLLFLFNAQATTIEDLSKHAQYHNIKISPDGKHLAALVDSDGLKRLVFLETDGYKITYALNSDSDSQPDDYYWVNNERVVIQIARMRGSLEKPFSAGELYAVNYDGKKGKMIFGYRAKEGIVLSADAGFIVDILKNDRKHILIKTQPLSRKTDVLPKIEKLNVYNGKVKRVKSAPIPYTQFLIDHNGQPRFAAGLNNEAETTLYYSDGKNTKWQPFKNNIIGDFFPVAFTRDNNSIYALKSEHGETQGLYKYDLKSQKETFLYRSKIADPTYTMQATLGDVYGIRIDEDYPKYIYLDENNNEAKLHKALFTAFKGDNVTITSKTADGKKVIVHVSSDRNPGTFYLFDTQAMQAKFLFNNAPQIKPNEMSAMEPFRLQTPDHLTLNGYITLPKSKKTNLPTVVLPHGGPHARDYWGFDSTVQMLANAGYAVIQVNFRGSTGYGRIFQQAGYGNWGTKIQNDIYLATQYAIQQGISDKNRVCIFGGSFGGYSALQSAINQPDLYKCAIGYAGVYDLPLLYNEGDIKTVKWGDAYLDKTLGTDVVAQKAQSPVYNVDKLTAPVLLIHGEDDQRAPIEHAIRLREALDKAHHPYEWLVKDKEGHGFYNEENILEMNKKILAFLNKYIGH
jgi:dipeptidyl aminopeptidase/acylaminoacyl peptidase